MAKKTDAYYEELFRNLLEKEGGGVASAAGAGTPGMLAGLKGKMGSLKGLGISLIGFYMMDKILSSLNQAANRKVQMEGLRGQADLMTPENLYYQASLPQAQAEEEQARNALLTQISGGVLGPSIAKGERRI